MMSEAIIFYSLAEAASELNCSEDRIRKFLNRFKWVAHVGNGRKAITKGGSGMAVIVDKKFTKITPLGLSKIRRELYKNSHLHEMAQNGNKKPGQKSVRPKRQARPPARA